MAVRGVTWILLLWVTIVMVNAQTSKIKPSIQNCYNETALPGTRFAYNRPPSTLNIFVEMIRILEDANYIKTARDLSVLMTQRWHQDGISNTGNTVDLRFGLPYMPNREEAYLSTLIQEKFLTNVQSDLYTGSLDDADMCALHFMISNSIDDDIRGDETLTCSRSARYTHRIIRDVPEKPEKDIETVVDNVDGFAGRTPLGARRTERSQCPIELGVIYTNSGALKASLVLAGITAGLNPETYANCNNGFAATLAGELAQVALTQASANIESGASGGWNSSLNPQYYFLQTNKEHRFTDAEIRGAVDGLYMAKKVTEWKSKYNDLKISQIFDIYYSPHQKGLFSKDFTSCNRNKLFTSVTSTEELQKAVLCMMTPLDDASQYGSSVVKTSYDSLMNAAVDSFNNYFPRLASGDMKCINDNVVIERAATDLMIFIDASWSYDTLKPTLTAILDGIDVNRFGSRYTIFLGSDGTNLTTTRTNYLLDFHKFYNRTTHDRANKGFDFTKVYQIVENEVKFKLNNNSYAGGEATTVLLIPKRVPNDGEKNFLEQKKQAFKQNLPDISVIVLGTGSASEFSSVLLKDTNFVQLTDSTIENSLISLSRETVDKIKNIPRAVVNPNCKADFTGSSSNFQLVNYAEIGGVNYYRISPQYFYTGGDNRRLKVTENNFGTIEVCLSRDQPKPTNQTNSECETIRAKEKAFDLSGYCGGSLGDCAPIYLSVAGQKSDNFKCTGHFCRFPDNIKYTIAMENVGCTSGTFKVMANFMLVAVLFVICKF